MNRPRFCISAIILFTVIFLSQSCRKDNLITDSSAQLKFSDDTIHFDTVFTTVGSMTIPLKIFNTYKNPISISSIELAGGENSQFRINVDGFPGVDFHDIEIPANDSLYLFAEVTIDRIRGERFPFVIEDSIVFVTNGNVQSVKLIAYGQNAHFHYGQIVGNTVWHDDLPHVIIGSVLVDSLCTLTITEGTNIYMHGGSYFYVLGTLKVEGTQDSIVTFQGDRLEDFYRDVPGQWEGIYYLRGSFGNTMKYTEIKNANEGIALGYSTSPELNSFLDNLPELDISNTQIHDCQDNGIVSLNSKIKATNVLVYNTGSSDAALFLGGDYNFRHCTLADYGSDFLTHQTPILGIFDYFEFAPDLFLQADLTQSEFVNCIVYGSIAEGNEIVIDTLDAVTVFDFNFDHSILRTDIDTSLLNDSGCIFNQDPLFTNISERNYIPGLGSPAIDAGIDIPGDPVNDDITGAPRPTPGTLPDIGCYETIVE